MIDDMLKDLDAHLSQSIEHFRKELAKVRTGRANASILDGVKVDYYGSPTPLAQVAAVNVPDARLITVKPWEKNLIPDIEKALRMAQLGLNPQSDGEIVRLPMPALTEERRKELVKVVRKMGEDTKVALRNLRRDANDQVKEMEKEKLISEDDQKVALKNVQDHLDKFVAQVDEILGRKEKEILEV